MSRFHLLVAVAALIAPPALAHTAPTGLQDLTGASAPQGQKQPSRATTVGSEQFELTDMLVEYPDAAPRAAWTSNSDRTSSRVGGRASSTRVVRACEISLTLDGDCAGK